MWKWPWMKQTGKGLTSALGLISGAFRSLSSPGSKGGAHSALVVGAGGEGPSSLLCLGDVTEQGRGGSAPAAFWLVLWPASKPFVPGFEERGFHCIGGWCWPGEPQTCPLLLGCLVVATEQPKMTDHRERRHRTDPVAHSLTCWPVSWGSYFSSSSRSGGGVCCWGGRNAKRPARPAGRAGSRPPLLCATTCGSGSGARQRGRTSARPCRPMRQASERILRLRRASVHHARLGVLVGGVNLQAAQARHAWRRKLNHPAGKARENCKGPPAWSTRAEVHRMDLSIMDSILRRAHGPSHRTVPRTDRRPALWGCLVGGGMRGGGVPLRHTPRRARCRNVPAHTPWPLLCGVADVPAVTAGAPHGAAQNGPVTAVFLPTLLPSRL